MIQFAGPIAEQKDLTGSESLTDLVEAFTETPATLTNPPQDEHAEQFRTRQQRLQNVIGQLLTEVPLPSQTKAIHQALNTLAAEYICSGFGRKYDRLSSDLFELKRAVKCPVRRIYDNEQTEFPVNIPLFSSVRFGSDKEWEFNGSVSIPKSKSRSGETSYSVTLSSPVPPITRQAKEKARQARADYLEVYSNALRQPLIGDMLMQDLERFNTGGGLDLHVCWIPKANDLDIEVQEIRKDPLLIAELYDQTYLVAQWDVLNEEPFQHYIEEFRESKANP